ncbi:MAG: GntR family transcriptional regulator [Chloroflexota bacterium]
MAEEPALPRKSDQVEEKLRRMIISLELAPGTMVSESYLMKLLGCGRTPLREAIQRLAQEYLLAPVPKRGVAVAGLDVFDFVALIEALVLVEGFSARLAAERISEKQLAHLEALVDRAERLSQQGDFSSVAQLDYEFHCTVAQATGNRYLADSIVRLHRLATRFGYVAWQREESAAASLAEHRQIIAAFKNRAAAEAERQTQEHMLKAKERITASF